MYDEQRDRAVAAAIARVEKARRERGRLRGELASFENHISLSKPYAETVDRVRAELVKQGFSVLTEIDLQAALREKAGVEFEPYSMLGACSAQLAHQALEVDRSVGVLLPCNVVVTATAAGTEVRILDPQILVTLTGDEQLAPMADEAARRLRAVLDALVSDDAGPGS